MPDYTATVRLCARAVGLPMPEAEVRFAPPRRWRFDFGWPSVKLAVEVNGAIWVSGRHSRGSGLVKEYEKMTAAAVLGWRVIPTTPRQIGDLAFWRAVRRAYDYREAA